MSFAGSSNFCRTDRLRPFAVLDSLAIPGSAVMTEYIDMLNGTAGMRDAQEVLGMNVSMRLTDRARAAISDKCEASVHYLFMSSCSSEAEERKY